MSTAQAIKRKATAKTAQIAKLLKVSTSPKLQRVFFDVSCSDLANALLGKLLCRRVDDVILKGRIVETECYLGGEDKASKSFGGRRTEGNEPMYMQPGTAYIYMTYGMYFCFNISSCEPGAAVLLRALDPVEEVDKMQELRTKKSKGQPKKMKIKELCNGPSKLCMSMDITKTSCNKLDLCSNEELWVETDPTYEDEMKIIKSTRVGIQSAGAEWANKLLRFYVLGNESVSKLDKKAENEPT